MDTSIQVQIKNSAHQTKVTKMLLLFQWILFSYYVILTLSVLSPNYSNIRVVSYSIIFFLNESLQISRRCLQLTDPLHLSALDRFIRNSFIICHINMVYLLIRIAFETQSLYSFLLSCHYVFMTSYSKHTRSKKKIKNENLQQKSILTPILLFTFSRTINADTSDVSFIELMFIAINAIATSEIRKIMTVHECSLFGWEEFQEKNRIKSVWNRTKAIKMFIFVSCVLVAVQNLLLLVVSIRKEISLTLLHSLGIGLLACYLYTHKPRI